MASIQEYREGRAGLALGPPPEQTADEIIREAETPTKAFQFPHWMDRKTIAWLVIVIASIILLFIIK